MTHKLAFLRLLDSGTDRTHSLHFICACRDKHLAESIIMEHETSKQTSHASMARRLQLLWIIFSAIMQSSINKSRRISIQNLSVDIKSNATSNGFSMAQLRFVACCVSWGFHSFSCLLAIVVTFNFKFSKIIICCTIQFFLWFQFEAERSAAKRFIVLRMDGKIVSGTAIVRVHFYTFIELIIFKEFYRSPFSHNE